MSIYTNFNPTRLYIKKHSVTGLLYFGKTGLTDIELYKGSGTYWQNHIKKHGIDHVINLWVSDWFTDPYDIEEFALFFSSEHNITTATNADGSKVWANLQNENGLDGGGSGKIYTQEQRSKISAYRKSEAFKAKHKKVCIHCNKTISSPTNYVRYHGDNCIKNINRTQESIEYARICSENIGKSKTTQEYKNKHTRICPHCNIVMADPGMYSRFHGDNCRNNENRPVEAILAEYAFAKKISEIIKSPDFINKHTNTCQYCNKTIKGNPTNFFRHHGDNCKRNPNRTPTEKAKIICGICNKSFTYIKRYNNHLTQCVK